MWGDWSIFTRRVGFGASIRGHIHHYAQGYHPDVSHHHHHTHRPRHGMFGCPPDNQLLGDTCIRLASVRWNHTGRRPCIRHRSWWSCSSDGQGDKKEDVGNGRVTLWSALASSIDWSSFRSDDRAIDISGFKNQESCCTTRHRTSVWPALVAPSVSNGATYILQCFQERGSCLQQ